MRMLWLNQEINQVLIANQPLASWLSYAGD